MDEESKTETVTAAIQPDAEEKKSARQKRKSSRQRKAAGEGVRLASAEPAKTKNASAKSRRYTEQDRIEKLNRIEAEVAEGRSTIKDAIKSAGISEQTYYQWKRIAKPAEQATDEAASGDEELMDLIQLEKENNRLRKLLADKLRKENLELRKRLGLDK